MFTSSSWRLNSSSRSSVVSEGTADGVADEADVKDDIGEACGAALTEARSRKPSVHNCGAMMPGRYVYN
jgi:hypothetical protein